MQTLRPLLEHIGLNHQESGVYLHLLGKGECAASVIARETGIPRSTVRGILDKLCAAGVLEKMTKLNTQYYTCKPPETLLSFLQEQVEHTKERMDRLREQLPMLDALHAKSNVVPRVRMFEGPKQIVEAFNHSLFTEGIDEILFVTSYRFLRDPVVRRNDDAFYIPRRVKKGIRMRVLVGQADDEPKPIIFDKKELRERRQLSVKHMLPGNFHVYGNHVAYFSAGDGEYLAILIESAVMAATMRSLFEVMWEMCGKK